jgi:hypothetical protein
VNIATIVACCVALTFGLADTARADECSGYFLEHGEDDPLYDEECNSGTVDSPSGGGSFRIEADESAGMIAVETQGVGSDTEVVDQSTLIPFALFPKNSGVDTSTPILVGLSYQFSASAYGRNVVGGSYDYNLNIQLTTLLDSLDASLEPISRASIQCGDLHSSNQPNCAIAGITQVVGSTINVGGGYYDMIAADASVLFLPVIPQNVAMGIIRTYVSVNSKDDMTAFGQSRVELVELELFGSNADDYWLLAGGRLNDSIAAPEPIFQSSIAIGVLLLTMMNRSACCATQQPRRNG